MTESEKFSLNPSFSHIYIEKDAVNDRSTEIILEKFKKSSIIVIDHYKDVFSRPNQNFQLQKSSLKLIIAKKREPFFYVVPEMCQRYDDTDFYYTSSVLNCMYNCHYCFLQGMHPSANIVMFVNIDDFFKAAKDLNNVTLSISYDSDLLALENIFPFTRKWLEYAHDNRNNNIELRTKSNNYQLINDISPLANVVLSWTLSPDELIRKYEINAPSLKSRISSINCALHDGWKVRLCFDPVLFTENWKTIYAEFISQVFEWVSPKKIYDISLGVFRMPSDYLKIIQKSSVKSDLIFYPFTVNNKIASYNNELAKQMTDFIYRKLCRFLPAEKIYNWEGGF